MLTDVEHVEAVALIRNLAERLLYDFPGNPTIAAALKWCDEHHPQPSAYMAAMSSLVERIPQAERLGYSVTVGAERIELTPRGQSERSQG